MPASASLHRVPGLRYRALRFFLLTVPAALRSVVSVFTLCLALFAAGAASAQAANSIQWNSIDLPATGLGGTTISFTATVENTGDDTWGWNHYLELKAMADGAHLWYPSVDGLEPGQQTTVTFWLELPAAGGTHTYGFTGMEHNVEYFGGTQTRTITVTPAPVYAGVNLSSTTLDPAALPVISTTDAMTPFYRLRTKILDGTGWGFHAATTWMNNGLRLDLAPPAGYYQAALYWLKYDAVSGNLLPHGQGPDRMVSLTVPAKVELTAYNFDLAAGPRIFSTRQFGGTYFELHAEFRNAAGAVWHAQSPRNQNMAELSVLPPAGNYQVTLFWKLFWNMVDWVPYEVGPPNVMPVTISSNAIPVLDQAGEVRREYTEDEEGNGSDYTVPGVHDFTVPVAGTLRLATSALYSTRLHLIEMPSESGLSSGDDALTLQVAAGSYRVVVDTNEWTSGPYQITGRLVPAMAKPVLTNGDTATGTFGVAYTAANPLHTITATGPGSVSYSASGLPAGLVIDPASGKITGTPTAAGTYSQVWVQAANPAGPTGKFITMIVAKATPVLVPGSFVKQERFDVPYFSVTPAMLNAQFTHPAGFSVGPPSPVTYRALSVPGGLVSNPFTWNSYAGIGYADSPLLVTAISPENENYNRFEVTVPFDCVDSEPPATPNARVVLRTPSSFSVSWDRPFDNVGVIGYEVVLNGGAQTFTPVLPNQLFTGLAPSSTHTVRVRARDYRGNWSQPVTVTAITLAAGQSPVYSALWQDVNGDGLRDEIADAPDALEVFAVQETVETVTYSNWVQDFIQLPGTWYYESVTRRFREGVQTYYYPYYEPGEIVPFWTEETQTIEVEKTLPQFRFVAQGGERYTVVRVFTGSDGGVRYGTLFPPTVFEENPLSPAAVHWWEPANFWPTLAVHAFPTKVVRLSQPPAGVQLNMPGLGQVSLRTGTGGVSGTMTLPGGVTIDAGANGVSISNGTATVSVNGGTTSVNISLPGGYQVTGVSNGTVTISGPGGASIATGPGGTTITMPGGTSITVNGSGAIGVTLPQGQGAALGNAIDMLGRALGIDLGNGIGTRTKIVPQGGDPSLIIWENSAGVDLGNRPPGVYTVGTTSDSRGMSETGPQPTAQNIVWFTLTIRPPTISLSGPTHMWINDDTDSGDFGAGDVPSPSAPNFSDSVVNGIRDLVDFFPVVLNLRDHVLAMPPGPDVKYKLKHAGGALNFVYSNLTSANADSYHRQVLPTGFGSNFNQPAGEAQTQQITAAGVELAASFLTRIGNGTGNVILIEGRAQSSTTLVLSVERADGAVISSFEMPLRISAVETMFRHVDLSNLNQEYEGAPISPSPAARVSQSGNPGDPYPDGMTNGKYFVFLHGYNVDGQQARGWNCEVFKRLYQMGSRARFVGVTWHGATGLDYHKAVYHAFQTGSVLGAHLSAFGVSGDVTVAAHSLGNMMVSHAIASGGFLPTRYFIINGAVPIEAYNYNEVDAVQRGKMIEDDWQTRDRRFYAANWHELFQHTTDDVRNQLKWKNRFFPAIENTAVYNFYSPGEDVVAKAETATAAVLVSVLRQGFNFTRGAWTAQELIKGVNWTTSMGALFLERKQAGWNARILRYGTNPGGEVANDTLKTEPYFERFLEQELMHTDWTIASAKAATGKVRNDLLARAIPALSYAVAVDQLPGLPAGRNFNMEFEGRQGGWPTDGHSGQNANRWLHSDFRNVALPYVHPMYLKMIELGGL
ncbi:MAG: putative Ig domain-containing protein [Opitutaceae bacterium]|nr:putative Ig domain-containing protein [Opitutaceae bacterium]